MAVCDKTFHLPTDSAGPYAGDVIAILPHQPVPPDQAPPFDCHAPVLRHPRDTKGQDYRVTHRNEAGPCECSPGNCC